MHFNMYFIWAHSMRKYSLVLHPPTGQVLQVLAGRCWGLRRLQGDFCGGGASRWIRHSHLHTGEGEFGLFYWCYFPLSHVQRNTDLNLNICPCVFSVASMRCVRSSSSTSQAGPTTESPITPRDYFPSSAESKTPIRPLLVRSWSTAGWCFSWLIPWLEFYYTIKG